METFLNQRKWLYMYSNEILALNGALTINFARRNLTGAVLSLGNCHMPFVHPNGCSGGTQHLNKAPTIHLQTPLLYLFRYFAYRRPHWLADTQTRHWD